MSGDRGEGHRGNREVSQVVILGALRRGDSEEGVRGGTWFPHATEPKAREVPA
jgi:hypothetical protein